MKAKYLFLIVLFLTFSLFLSNIPAQDYTRWHLSEGAKARLGKGQITGDIAYSPDGSLLAVASSIGVWVYNTHNGVELDLLIGHTSSVRCVVFSPDGSLLASGSEDRTVCLWDASTGQHLKTLTTDHRLGVGKVVFFPDGRTLATGAILGDSIQLWNIVSGRRKKIIVVFSGTFSLSPNGQTLAYGNILSGIDLWDVVSSTRKELWDENVYGEILYEEILEVAFSPDGRTLAIAHRSLIAPSGIDLWDTVKGVRLRTLTINLSIGLRHLAFSPDGHTLATGNVYGEIYLWDVINGTRKDLITHYHPLTRGDMELSTVIDLAFSPDGQTLAVASVPYGGEETIRFLNVVDGSDKKTISGHGGRIRGLAFSPNGNTLASGSAHFNGYVTFRLWDTVSGVNKKQFTMPDVNNISFSPDGSTLAISRWRSDDTVCLWDIVNGKHKKILKGHIGWVKSIAFSPDGHLIASGSTDKTVRLWDAVSGEHKKTLTGHQSLINSVCFSPDGQLLASGSEDKTVRLWDTISGKHKNTLTGHWYPINSVCFSPNGQLLASGSEDKTVRLWDINTGKHLKTFIGNENKVTSVCFSPDGQLLASGSEDKTVRLWDINTEKLLKTFTGHTNFVQSVCFSSDGRLLASGSDDGTVLIWNIDVSTSQTPSQVLQQESTEQVTTPLTPEQIAKRALASTVLIVMEDANGKPLSSGSGFFIGRGLIATNFHVVEKGTRGTFKQVGKDKWYNIKDTIKMDKQRDLVILNVSDIGTPALPLGNSDKVQIGQSVYAVGNPIGFLDGTFAPGFVSSIRGKEPNRHIQITAPISKGSSGGPLLNDKGQVIGIVVGAIEDGQNLNFAIPSNYLSELLDNVKEQR